MSLAPVEVAGQDDVVGRRRGADHLRSRDELVIGNLPERDGTIIVPEQDIALTIAGEVADAGAVIVGRGRADRNRGPDRDAAGRPDRELPGIAAQQDIVAWRAVEVAGAEDQETRRPLAKRAARHESAGAVGLPYHDIAGVVLKQDVGAAIVVEVAEAGAVVVERRGGEELSADAGWRSIGCARRVVLPGNDDV